MSVVTSLFSAQVQQVRLESEEHRLKLEATQEEAREATVSLERETEQVRRELLGRLGEMEALPDRLRRAELQLRGARQEADAHERRNAEHNSALAEVRQKVLKEPGRLGIALRVEEKVYLAVFQPVVC